MKIILLGAPGSGKGTISTLLTKDNNFKHISTGDLFRKILEEDSKLASEIKNYVNFGKLVPDELTNQLFKETIEKNIKNGENIIFDGYPRNIDQAKFLEHICKIDIVILLNIEKDVLTKRILGRRICPLCQTIYNIDNGELKNSNLCNKDNSILLQRKDDNEETIKNRIKVYEKTFKPLIEFYEAQKNLYRIEANKTTTATVREILKIVKELNDNN